MYLKNIWYFNKIYLNALLFSIIIFIINIIAIFLPIYLINGSIDNNTSRNYLLLSMFTFSFIVIIFTFGYLLYAKKLTKMYGELFIPYHYCFNEYGIGIKAIDHVDMIRWNEIAGIERKLFGGILFIFINRKITLPARHRMGSEFGDVVMVHSNKELLKFWELYKPAFIQKRIKSTIPYFLLRYNEKNDKIFHYKNSQYISRLFTHIAIILLNSLLVLTLFIFGSHISQIIIIGITMMSVIIFIINLGRIPTSINIKNDCIEINYLYKKNTHYIGEYDFFHYDNGVLRLYKNQSEIKKYYVESEELKKDIILILESFK